MALKRALVSYNKDPDRLGRVRIRIPGLHGVSSESLNYIKPDALPWASPCVMGFCGPDMGSYNVPPVGTWVWVDEEEGESPADLKYVYMGGIMSAAGAENPPSFNDITGTRNILVDQRYKEVSDDYADMGVCPGSSEESMIKDVHGKASDDYYPHQRVIFKSPKGATIMVDETDGEESLSIIDRIGQIIHFKSPVKKSDNKGNGKKRGTASALKGSQLEKDGCSILFKSMNVYHEIDPEKSVIEANNGTKQTITEDHWLTESHGASGEISEKVIEFKLGASKITMTTSSIIIESNGSTITVDAAGVHFKGTRIDLN